MILSVNLVTRGRSDLLGETIERALANISMRSTELMVSCDDDDEASVGVALAFPEVTVSVRPREDSVGEKVNRVLAEAPADIYMVLVDFVSILTRGFDEMIVEAASVFRDGYAVLNGPLANLSFPSVQAVTHKFADAAGGIYPTYWPFWFIDHWLDDLGRMIGRMGFAPVNVDPSRRPGKTHELRDLPLWTRIYDLTAPERHQQACNIMAQPDFEASDWMKEALAQYWPQIDLRSRAINALVLAGEDHIAAARGGVEPDERYLRIKANGEALLAQLQEQR